MVTGIWGIWPRKVELVISLVWARWDVFVWFADTFMYRSLISLFPAQEYCQHPLGKLTHGRDRWLQDQAASLIGTCPMTPSTEHL